MLQGASLRDALPHRIELHGAHKLRLRRAVLTYALANLSSGGVANVGEVPVRLNHRLLNTFDGRGFGPCCTIHAGLAVFV